MNTDFLPSLITLRILAWLPGASGLFDVCELTSREELHQQAKKFLVLGADHYTIDVVSRWLEEDVRMADLKGRLVKGTPIKCQTEQPCVQFDGVLLSLDLFWDMLCESIKEMRLS